jgi:hypothetical protein
MMFFENHIDEKAAYVARRLDSWLFRVGISD